MTSHPATPALETAAHAIINVDLPGSTISRHLYGHFAEHLGRCVYDGIYVGDETTTTPTRQGVRTDVVDALRNIGVPNLRWPGGCFADEYHWEDGVGPKAERPTVVNSNWGDVVDSNAFGTHEFLDLCEQIGAEPYVSANVGSGSVREASEWIEYMTRADDSPMARRRRENGRDEPWSVRFWGLGNEPWGCGGKFSPEAYVQMARTYGLYSRDHGDNKLYRIAAGASSDDYHWTDVLMRGLGFHIGGRDTSGEGVGAYDAISFHHYTIPGPWSAKGSATTFTDDEFYATIREAARIETILAGHAAVMDAYDPGKTIGLVLDEWGTWFDVEKGTNPGFLYQQNTVRDALVAGIHFDAFHRHADRLVLANIAQVVNVLQAVILTDGADLILTPTYHVFEMNRGHHDAQALDVRLTTEAPAVRHGEDDVPTLSTSASVKDGRVLLSCTNASLTTDLKLAVEIRGAHPNGAVGRILTGTAASDHNTVTEPTVVQPTRWDNITIDGDVIHVVVPKHSFVTVSIPLRTSDAVTS